MLQLDQVIAKIVCYHSSAALFFVVHKATTESTQGDDARRPKLIITVEGLVIYNNREG